MTMKFTQGATGHGRLAGVGVVGVLRGDCTNFNIVDLPFAGALRAAAWPSGDSVVAGGDGGSALVNGNRGVPARAVPDRRQRLAAPAPVHASFPTPTVAPRATPRGATAPRIGATALPRAATAARVAPASRGASATATASATAIVPRVTPLVVGPLRRHVTLAPAERVDARAPAQR